MIIPEDTLQLTLMLETDGSTDLAEARELALRLRDELRNADVLAAEFVTNPVAALPGAKSPTQITSDPIWLTIAINAIPSIILLIQSWLLRQQNQTLKVKIGEVELEVPRKATQAEIDLIVSTVRQIAPSERKPSKRK
ncbi:MAG: hypothetical protein ACOYNY_31710 [Caldilineaceae bacterium]